MFCLSSASSTEQGSSFRSSRPFGQYPVAGGGDVLVPHARARPRRCRPAGNGRRCRRPRAEPTRELSADRNGPGDVGGVEVVVLHPHVHQQQLARAWWRPVLRIQCRMVASGARPDDRRIAQFVALVAGPELEDAFEQPFGDRSVGRQDPGDVLETTHGGVDRVLQLGDLPLVLDQAKLGQGPASSRSGCRRRRCRRSGWRCPPTCRTHAGCGSGPVRSRPGRHRAGPAVGSGCRVRLPSSPACGGDRSTARRTWRCGRTRRCPAVNGAGCRGWPRRRRR